jgi:hypothetical protein
LRFQQRPARQREAHATQAKRGIGFVAQGQAGAVGLVRAQVQRADRDRSSAHAEHDIAVGAELFFLVRQFVALQEQEFGAVQADAGGAQRVRFGDVLARLGIRIEVDVHRVDGARGFAAQAMQFPALADVLALARAMRAQVGRAGLGHHQAAAAIDDQRVAVVDPEQGAGHADDEWQVQAAGEDGAVRQRAAGGGDDRNHALRLQLREFGGGDVVGDEDLAGNAFGALLCGCAGQRGCGRRPGRCHRCGCAGRHRPCRRRRQAMRSRCRRRA